MKSLFFILITLCIFLISACDDSPSGGGPADAGLYHNYEELNIELKQLETNFPQLAHVENLGVSIENRSILAIKISDNVGLNENEPQILFVGGHHAREWISVDVPLLLAKHLLNAYSQNARIQNLINNGEIWIIPLLNPDGHNYSVNKDRMWRKNRRKNSDGSYGVDLNRNYSYEWGGPGSSGSTYSETYRGTKPFSEPESAIIRDFATAHNFRAMISYHNFSQLVLFPWGYTYSSAPDEVQLKSLAKTMADSIYNVHGKIYTPEQNSDLYRASGDATDWLYGETKAPSFTIELRPKSSSPGFALPEKEIQATFEENLPAALFLIEWSQSF